MEIKLKEYQAKAVESIKKSLTNAIDEGSKRTVVFKSPTGSGKTIMAGTIIKELGEDLDNVAFLWFSVANGELHTQSANKITEFYPTVQVGLLDNTHFGVAMSPSKVYVGSWNKLNNKKNIFMREGENFNFKDFLAKTRENDTKIIMIVDESHLGSGKESNITKVKDIIDADATLNLSATPKTNVDYEVSFDDVIDAGIIKKDIYVNKDCTGYIDKDELTKVLYSAIDKRDELARLYPDTINPLCVVQLPNGFDKKDEVEALLELRNKTKENGKVAVWLSKEKVNLETITKLDDKVEFLLFKSAIATGWDCTRAHVLVKLRDTKSNAFEIQTVGRILRMPEKKHYGIDALNSAYIYSDLDNFSFEESAFKSSAIKTIKTELNEDVDLELNASFKKRIQINRVYSDKLAPYIYDLLDNASVQFDTKDISTTILGEVQLELKDLGEDLNIIKTQKVIASPQLINSVLKAYFKTSLGKRGDKRSVIAVINIITKWIGSKKGWSVKINPLQAWKVILNEKELMAHKIETAINDYEKTLNELIEDNTPTEFIYSPIKEVWSNEGSEEIQFNKYAYSQCYQKMNKPELEYAKSLDSNEEILYWFKNGDSGKDNFSITYDGGNFYPDFIIKYKNGDIKVSETKGMPFHVQEKADALRKWGKQHGILTEYILE